MIWHPPINFECTWDIWDNIQKSRFDLNCRSKWLHQITNNFCPVTQKLRDKGLCISSKYATTQKQCLPVLMSSTLKVVKNVSACSSYLWNNGCQCQISMTLSADQQGSILKFLVWEQKCLRILPWTLANLGNFYLTWV